MSPPRAGVDDEFVATEVGELLPRLVAFRRDLHAHPEQAWTETRTTARVADALTGAGLRPRHFEPGPGLCCDVGPAAGPLVALRADLDALPIDDEKDVPYRSTVPGVAHVCGHDVHTTVVLGAGLVLARLAAVGRMSGRVRLLFQPAEEVLPGGALMAIGQGALDGVDRLFALHCDPRLDAGLVAGRTGAITAATDSVTVRVSGPGGHTARPQLTADVIGALGDVLTRLPTLLSRRVDPLAGLSLVWGQVHAGSAANVIPERGELPPAAFRVLDVDVWGRAEELVSALVAQVAEPFGVAVETEYVRGVPPAVNDPRCAAILDAAADRGLGPGHRREASRSMGERTSPGSSNGYPERSDGSACAVRVRRRRRTCTAGTSTSTSRPSAAAFGCSSTRHCWRPGLPRTPRRTAGTTTGDPHRPLRGRSAMFATLGRLVDAHPWRVLALWAVAAVAVIAFSPKLSTYTSNNNSAFLPSSYQSVEAQAALVRAFPATAGASGIVVVSRDDGEPLSATDQQRVAGLATALSSDHLPSVRSVATSPAYLSPDKRVQLALVSFDGQSGQPGPNEGVAAVRHRTDQLLAGSGLRGGLTGTAAISVDSTAAFNNAEKIIGLATVLLILALLGIVFRSPVIAVLPIVVIGVVHQMAQGLTAWLAQGLGFVVGPDLAPLLLVVMFGVGTDYMVFLLFRYRERIAAGDDPHEALRYSVTRVGEVITSAAATVAAAFAALLVASLESLRTLAPGLIVGVALMLLAALTLVPAIISLFGRHLFWPTRPTAPDPAHRTPPNGSAGSSPGTRSWCSARRGAS